MFTSTKTFRDFPCAHRQWRHSGNCALIHGYSRSFRFTFGASTRNQCGFIMDFGNLKWLKAWLEEKFDHTLLIEHDDPYLKDLAKLGEAGVCNLVIPPYGVGMEGTAQWLFEHASKELLDRHQGRVWIISVEAMENDKNSAIYTNPAPGATATE